MNTNQRNQGSKDSKQAGGSADQDKLNRQQDPAGSQQSGRQPGQQGDQQIDQQIDQQGSQQQGQPGQKQSNDLSGGYPRSPGGANQLSSDEDMDEDTGLSNRENRQSAIDQGSRQASQSNVGRRDDGTPD